MMLNANVEPFKEGPQQALTPPQIDHNEVNSPLLQHLDHRRKFDQFRTCAETHKNLGRLTVNYFDHIFKYDVKHSLMTHK